MTDQHAEFRDWDAAYVLGALSSDDRRAFERHLQTCAECAAAVAELAGLPGILSKLPVSDAVGLDSSALGFSDAHLAHVVHEPGLVQRLAVQTRRRRRRSRWMIAGASLAVVLLVGGIGTAVAVSNQGPVTAVAMTPVDQKVITASIQIEKKGWGTRFDWSCSYAGGIWKSDDTAAYDLVVTDRSGAQTTVATWSIAGPRATGLTASTSIPTADIARVEIRLSGTTAPLLRDTL